METLIPLGCVVNEHSSILSITSDIKERIAAGLFSSVFGISFLLIIIIIPFKNIGFAGVIVFSFISIFAFILSFLILFFRSQIDFDIDRKILSFKFFFFKKIIGSSSLPIENINIISSKTKGKGAELQIIISENKIWTRWAFYSKPFSDEVYNKIKEHLKGFKHIRFIT